MVGLRAQLPRDGSDAVRRAHRNFWQLRPAYSHRPHRAPGSRPGRGCLLHTRSNVNFIAEYDLHQAGLSTTDWRHWFAAGTAGNPLLDAELWYLRDYAAVQQEPISRQSLFLRVAKDNWLTPNLSASALALVDLTGTSGLGQADVSYRVSTGCSSS